MKKIAIAAAAVILLAAAFWGGMFYAGASNDAGTVAAGDFARGDRTGGPMGDLTEEDRAAMLDMTDEERQAFFEEQFDGAVPADGTMPGGGMRGARGGMLEGEVVDIADETVTIALADGGSQTVYTYDETVIAYAEGATTLAAGSDVMVYAESEADGVQTATLIVVR